MSGRQSSATEYAIMLVKRERLTRYQAAKRAGIALSTLYRAMPELNEELQKRKLVANENP